MNDWGVYPCEYKVLIEVNEQSDVLGRDKVIFVPDDARDRFQQAQVLGTLIAVGGNAFSEPKWLEPVPELGNKVYFAKYAGIRLKRIVEDNGKRKELWAVLANDKDIAAIVDPTKLDIEE